MEDLRLAMKRVQDASRYEHTLGVAYTAACLAGVYGIDTRKAIRAGLLHDCAKCMSDLETISLCKEYGIVISEVEMRNPSALLHAKLGAKLAFDKYNEKDEDVLRAIEYHTTGRPNMSMLEKIIFVADYMEPGRDKAPNLYEIRKVAFHDIDKALVTILQDTLEYLSCKNKEIDPATKRTLEYYSEQQ